MALCFTFQYLKLPIQDQELILIKDTAKLQEQFIHIIIKL